MKNNSHISLTLANDVEDSFGIVKNSFYSLIDNQIVKTFIKIPVEGSTNYFSKSHLCSYTPSPYRSCDGFNKPDSSNRIYDKDFTSLMFEVTNLQLFLFQLYSKTETFCNDSENRRYELIRDIEKIAKALVNNKKARKAWGETLSRKYENKDLEDTQKCNEMIILALISFIEGKISDADIKEAEKFSSEASTEDFKDFFETSMKFFLHSDNPTRLKASFDLISYICEKELKDSLEDDEEKGLVEQIVGINKVYKNSHDELMKLERDIEISNSITKSLNKEELKQAFDSDDAFDKLIKFSKRIESHFGDVKKLGNLKSTERNDFVNQLLLVENSDDFEKISLSNELNDKDAYNKVIYNMSEFRNFKKSIAKKTLAPTMINSIFLSLNNHQKFIHLIEDLSEDEIVSFINNLSIDSFYGVFNNTVVSVNYAFDHLDSKDFLAFLEQCSKSKEFLKESLVMKTVNNFDDLRGLPWDWIEGIS